MNVEYPCLQPFYEIVFNDTVSDKATSREIKFVLGFFEEWAGNFVHPIGHDLHSANQSESILYCYMATQSFTFDWLSHSLLLGNYETVLRELRSILENLFFMFYLELVLRHPNLLSANDWQPNSMLFCQRSARVTPSTLDRY